MCVWQVEMSEIFAEKLKSRGVSFHSMHPGCECFVFVFFEEKVLSLNVVRCFHSMHPGCACPPPLFL